MIVKRSNYPEIRFTIEDVFHITNRGITVTGKMSGGSLRTGDIVNIIRPSKEGKEIITIENARISGLQIYRKLVDEISDGDNAGITLEGNFSFRDIKRGDILVKSTNTNNKVKINKRNFPPTEKEIKLGNIILKKKSSMFGGLFSNKNKVDYFIYERGEVVSSEPMSMSMNKKTLSITLTSVLKDKKSLEELLGYIDTFTEDGMTIEISGYENGPACASIYPEVFKKFGYSEITKGIPGSVKFKILTKKV